MTFQNRRRIPRFTREMTFTYQDEAGRQASGVTLNLSEKGARVVLRGVASRSSRVNLNIDGLELEARAVWELPMGTCRVVGLQFEAMYVSRRLALRCLLEECKMSAKP